MGAASAADVVVEAAADRSATVIGITGGVAAGKSTLAAAVAPALRAAVVATDGFLFPNATLADNGLEHRKGFAESFDTEALRAFVDQWRATGRATAPRYSHLLYDVAGSVEVADAACLVLEGLHLGHPAFGLHDRIDLLVHIDAAVEDLARWYLARFQELRTTAASQPDAFLYPYRDMAPDVLDRMAIQVWDTLNVVLLEEEIRPYEAVADLVIRLDADHGVAQVEFPLR